MTNYAHNAENDWSPATLMAMTGIVRVDSRSAPRLGSLWPVQCTPGQIRTNPDESGRKPPPPSREVLVYQPLPSGHFIKCPDRAVTAFAFIGGRVPSPVQPAQLYESSPFLHHFLSPFPMNRPGKSLRLSRGAIGVCTPFLPPPLFRYCAWRKETSEKQDQS
jgi:hypothetical protein